MSGEGACEFPWVSCPRPPGPDRGDVTVDVSRPCFVPWGSRPPPPVAVPTVSPVCVCLCWRHSHAASLRPTLNSLGHRICPRQRRSHVPNVSPAVARGELVGCGCGGQSRQRRGKGGRDCARQAKTPRGRRPHGPMRECRAGRSVSGLRGQGPDEVPEAASSSGMSCGLWGERAPPESRHRQPSMCGRPPPTGPPASGPVS